ncbi:MAG: hypothetical protein JXJ04_08095, partial [Spirochaetales bacterium]|nr:hypothetical protein [Spirochaetales bacterium]
MTVKTQSNINVIHVLIIFLFILCFFVFTSCISTPFHQSDSINTIRSGVVKIFTTSVRPLHYIPWKMDNNESSTGSGAIIEGNMILTNAHVVSDSTYIEVQKENDPKKYKAKVLYIGH